MLERKIYKQIEYFYESNPHKALMITGALQVGKSFIIEKYAREHFSHVIVIDFIKEPDKVDLFQGIRSAEDIIIRLSSVYGAEMVPGETIIFFDEVQECKELITQIKYLVTDGKYRYILSGSLLGTVFSDIRSVPVGYMNIIRMYPLDFEEFARANGVGDKVFELLEKSFCEKTEIDSFLHERMMSLFELYMIVGGMPAAVSQYLKTKNLKIVADEQNSIIESYKKDISKYDKLEKLNLSEIFDLIPSELNSKNKRFILKNLNENAKLSKYINSFIWLKNAGVALLCYVADEPKIPLLLSKATNLFKLFLCDVGLLASQYGEGIQLDILKHETNINFGSVYENIAAQELSAHGYSLFYYNSKKHGEVDFLIEKDGHIVPVEIKSGKDYYRHNAMSGLVGGNEYDITKGYVFCNGNIEERNNIVYYPIYMLMCLKKKEIPDEIIYDTDFSDINDCVK